MTTAKQTELIGHVLAQLSGDELSFCRPVIDSLLSLGYAPRKHKKSTFVVEFEKYGRIIAKIEINHQKKLLFWLRFSAAGQYPPVYQDAVNRRPEAWVKRNQEWENHDAAKCCHCCKGDPRFYRCVKAGGAGVNRCGGCTIPVPGVTPGDVRETLRLIKEQDDYFAGLFR